MLLIVSLDGELKVSGLGITAPDGTFTISNVPPGVYKLVTVDMAYGTASYYLPEFYDDGGSTLEAFDTAQTIVVSASNNTPLNTISLAHTP